MTTLRLPIEYEQRLKALSAQKKKTKTDLIKEALEQFLYKEETEKNSYEIGEPYFGRYGSKDGLLSTSYKQKIREKLNAKHRTH